MQKIACQILKVPAEKVRPEARLREDLEADSLFLTQFLLALEDEFAIETDDGDIAEIFTIEDTVNYVAQKIGAK